MSSEGEQVKGRKTAGSQLSWCQVTFRGPSFSSGLRLCCKCNHVFRKEGSHVCSQLFRKTPTQRFQSQMFQIRSRHELSESCPCACGWRNSINNCGKRKQCSLSRLGPATAHHFPVPLKRQRSFKLPATLLGTPVKVFNMSFLKQSTS